MLKYNHVYNIDTKYPYNIACISSSATNVALYVNKKLQEIVSPNVVSDGIVFSTSRRSLTDLEILNLVYSGTIKSYTNELNKAIFGPTNKVYIRRASDNYYLYKDINNQVSWSSTTKSRFFFNPYYFDSDYLWRKIFKQRPDNIETTSLWDSLEEQRLFNRSEIILDVTSLPLIVEPLVHGYFETTQLSTSISLSHIIELKANYGDIIELKTDKDILTFTYEPTSGSRMIIPDIDNSSCTRPWIHIPIKIIDPNKDILYTKILNLGENNFIIRIEENEVVFTKSLTITR